MTPEQNAAVAVWENACLSSSLGGQESAARIIQQYGDQCRAEAGAAGFRRGVEAATKVADEGHSRWRVKSGVTTNKRESRDYETMAMACVHVSAAILALLETQETSHEQ